MTFSCHGYGAFSKPLIIDNRAKRRHSQGVKVISRRCHGGEGWAMGSLETLLEGSMPIVSMGRLFPRAILTPSQIFVNHSKLLVGFIGVF